MSNCVKVYNGAAAYKDDDSERLLAHCVKRAAIDLEMGGGGVAGIIVEERRENGWLEYRTSYTYDDGSKVFAAGIQSLPGAKLNFVLKRKVMSTRKELHPRKCSTPLRKHVDAYCNGRQSLIRNENSTFKAVAPLSTESAIELAKQLAQMIRAGGIYDCDVAVKYCATTLWKNGVYVRADSDVTMSYGRRRLRRLTIKYWRKS